MHKKKAVDLSDKRLIRLILKLGIPAILGLAANAINQFIDALWITRYSPFAMAAIGLTFPVFMVVLAATAGVGVATAGEIGRRLGRKDVGGAQNMVLTAFLTALIISICLAVLVSLFAKDILLLIGASEQTLPMASRYLLIMLAAIPFATFQIVSDFTALGSGHSRHSMYALTACFGLNIILDPIFIFGFGWGVTGAALATIAGQLLACAIYVFWFKAGTLGLFPHKGNVGRTEVFTLLRFSPPITLVNLLTAVSFLFLLREVARFADDIYVAAITFDLRLVFLIILPIQGLALGAQAAVSHSYGAGQLKRSQQIIHYILLLSLGLGVFLTGTIALLDATLFPLMVPAADMQLAAVRIFPYFAAYIVGNCIFIPLLSGFQATDKALSAAIVALAPNGYIMLPLIFILPSLWGFEGLLWAPVISGFLTAVIAFGLHIVGLSKNSTTAVSAPADMA